MCVYKIETFLRKLRHLKFLDKRFGQTNDGLTALFCNTKENDKIFVHLFDEIYDLSVGELVKDIEDALGIDGSVNESIQYIIDYLVYDANFGTTGKFWLVTKDAGYDCTVWNTYCDMMGVLNQEISDSFAEPKFVV